MDKETGLPVPIAVRNQGMVQGVVDGEVMMLNVETGTCYGLNKVGSRIWALIEEPRHLDDVCATLVGEYEIDDAACRSQVMELLKELHEEGMVEFREELAADAT
jgi:hypothetical protein